MRIAPSLLFGLLLAVVSTGCASPAGGRGEPDAQQDGPSELVDCVSPFHFEGREYRLAAGPGVTSGDVGERLGEGSYESCDQYGPGGGDASLVGPRAAYAFPGAPAEQAIVLTSADGRGSVLLAHDRPEGGWDADLKDWTALLGAV
ncbi:hypothetical protein [Nocardioides ochotonae]|uniref:hypothetical protein n=1 Tax=Nocardioides ochotonae TaxID=2685869 RepID=UPI0014081A6C|nr:hypothetical protein [Nocardioides ochotonae]